MYGKEVIKCIPSIVLLFEEHLHQHFFSNARCVQMSCMAIKTILRGNHKCELLAKSYITTWYAIEMMNYELTCIFIDKCKGLLDSFIKIIPWW